ncbi:MAG: tetratricopeptide repeat protein [Desulfobacteraceae bacterium]|jgi:tetratricopeptide (TPR) repeat protein
MSLLNDALRKRRQEPAGHRQGLGPPSPVAVSKRRRRPRATWLIAVAMAAGGLSAPLWQTAGTQERLPTPLETLENQPFEISSRTGPAPAGPSPAAMPPSRMPAVTPPAPPATTRAPQAPKPAPAAAARPPRPTLSQPANPAPDDSPFYTKAKALHRQQRFSEAIAFYRQALTLAPDHAGCRFNLATAQIASGAFEEAYPLLKALAASAPPNPDTLLNLAIAEIGTGRLEAAAASLEMARALPGAPQFEIHFHRGVLYSRSGRPQAAIASYRQALALKPGHSGVLFNLALAYDRLAQYPQALDYYLRSLSAADGLGAEGGNQTRRRIQQLQTYLSAPAKASPDRHLSSGDSRPPVAGRN